MLVGPLEDSGQEGNRKGAALPQVPRFRLAVAAERPIFQVQEFRERDQGQRLGNVQDVAAYPPLSFGKREDREFSARGPVAAAPHLEFVGLARVVLAVAAQQVQAAAAFEVLLDGAADLGDRAGQHGQGRQVAAAGGEGKLPGLGLSQHALSGRQPDHRVVAGAQEAPVVHNPGSWSELAVTGEIVHRLVVLLLELGALRAALQVVADGAAPVRGQAHVLPSALHGGLNVFRCKWRARVLVSPRGGA
ncbi:hypothetical protein DEMA109039_05690 [Deinococcus marmoris]